MKKLSLTKKIVIALALLSILITFITTCFQVFNIYFQEKNIFSNNLNQVERLYKKSISEALWNMNLEQLKVQLKGLSSIPGVVKVTVVDTDKKTIEEVTNPFTKILSQTELKVIPLLHEIRENNILKEDRIGDLILVTDNQYIFQKIYNDLLSIILIQTIRNFLITLIFYFFVDKIITNPLIRLFKEIPAFSGIDSHKKIKIKRIRFPISFLNFQDEIDELEDAINLLHTSAVSSYNQMTALNVELEDRVELKTRQVLEHKSLLEQNVRLSSLGEMAAGVAHEINNPLTIVLMKISAFKKNRGDVVKESHLDRFTHDLEVLEKNTMRISYIVRSLKTISRNSNDDPFVACTLKSLFDDTLAMCDQKIIFNSIDFKIEGNFLETSIQCHPSEIIQVLINLISNAIDAIQNLDEKWIRVRLLSEDDDYIMIAISDSGKGIPKEFQEKIFEPFFTTKEPGKGTGIGLSLSSKIISNNSGSLSYDTDRLNTTFTLKLLKAKTT